MFDWATPAMNTLWHNGLAVIPLVVVAAAASRLLPCLPATRHMIWVTVLIWLVGSSILPEPPVERVGAELSQWATSLSNKRSPVPTASDKAPILRTRNQPRDLSSRLEKRAAKRIAASARNSARSPSQPEFSEVSEQTENWPTESTKRHSSPPPRIAARAVNPSPDKLARARDAAGPRTNWLTETGHREGIERRARSEVLRTQAAGRAPGDAKTSSEIAPERARLIDSPRPEPVHSELASTKGDVRAGSKKTPQPQAAIVDRSIDSSVEKWTAAVMGIRDAIVEFPPLPRNIWLGGTAMLLLIAAWRVVCFQNRLRRARPADHDVIEIVESAAASLGLKRIPRTMMVDGRLSPMVWCGVTPKLILPSALWEQLDELGRKAVVFHELAHIRRLDHRTAWIESAIGMLYWWHPVVWWVRSRLHAEAENCCDAWVMTLLPRTRRAYATALLKTREYLSGDGDAVPAMGIGITPGRARLFARRLTMVMTESIRPRLSVSGIGLVMMIAVCGWVTTPARSCPEEEAAAAAKGAKAPCATTSAQPAPCASPKAGTPCAKPLAGHDAPGILVSQPTPGAPAQPAVIVATPAVAPAAPAGIVQVSDRNMARAKRMAELQAELSRLEQKIETLSEALEEQAEAAEEEDEEEHEHAAAHGHARNHDDDDDADDDDEDDDTPRAARAPRAPRAAMPPIPPMPPMPAMSGRGMGVIAGPTPKPGQSWADVTGEETTWRTYKLTKGKGDDFFKFMSRSDVPIWVRANSEGIDIQATPRQHEVFNVFFGMVDPSRDRESSRGGFGAAGPLFASAEGLGHACGSNCGRCRQSIERRAMAEELRASARAQAIEHRARARGDAERARAEAREEADKARARLRRHARDARSEASDNHEAIEGLERQSQVLAEVAQSYQEQAETIRERANSVSERMGADEEYAKAADAYRLHVESLERGAEELNRQAEQLQRESERIEERAREVEENAREMEQHADELDQRAEAVREAVDSLENGVQPTPELVESVLALVSGIEQMMPEVAMNAIDEAVSAVGSIPVIIEEPDMEAPEADADEDSDKDGAQDQ